jgi:cytochrome P450
MNRSEAGLEKGQGGVIDEPDRRGWPDNPKDPGDFRNPDDTEDPEDLVDQLLAPPFAADPYPIFNRLRDAAPMFRSRRRFWCASTYDACLEVFRSPVFAQGFSAGRLNQDPRFADSPSLQLFGRMLPFMNPPDHTRVRRLLAPYFTPKAIEELRVYTDDLVSRLLDRLAAEGGGDLVSDFADNVPVAVVCQLVGGVGQSDQGKCRAWAEGLSEAIHPVVDDTMMKHADDAADAFRQYFTGLIDATDRQGDDLMSRLISARESGTIDEDELLATATTLVGAAYHNTRNHIATGIFTMLRHPDQLRLLRKEPERAKAAVEELLRFEPPVQLTLPRVALTDVEMGGVTVRAGEHVCGFLGGAHRDPCRYRRPDQLDIDRDDGGSLALAFGIHSCIGAAMARMEGEVAIGRFFERFPSAELIDSQPQLQTASLPTTRGFTSIRVQI